jgi:hypothetical protein
VSASCTFTVYGATQGALYDAACEVLDAFFSDWDGTYGFTMHATPVAQALGGRPLGWEATVEAFPE